MKKLYPTLWARLLANCRVTDDGCWEWTGQRSTSPGRYPQMSMRVDGKHKTVRAHRVAAEIVLRRKLDPVFETIEHRCDNTACILPNDFLLAPSTDNSRSMIDRRMNRACSAAEMKTLWPEEGDNCDDVPLFNLRYWHPSEPIPF